MGGLSEQKRVGPKASSKVLRAVALAPKRTRSVIHPTIGGLRENQEARILLVLRSARALLAGEGWAQRPLGYRGGDLPGLTLDQAISEAGEAGVASEWARKCLRRIIGNVNIPAWNDDAFRTAGEVFALLDRAILMNGGNPVRRGGWVVGGGH